MVRVYRTRIQGGSGNEESGATRVLYGLIATNVGVYAAWALAQSNAQHRDARLLMSMEQNFVASTRNLVRRPWTVATSAFSHDDTRHLLFNMLSLYMMGMGLAQSRMIGGRVLLGVYVLGGVASSLSHIASARFSRDPWAAGRGCVGASGSVMALSAFYATLFPHAQILLFGIVPMPAYFFVGGLALVDLYYLNDDRDISHAGHLGGAVLGFVCGRMFPGRFIGRRW